jgi:cell wall-associated NlpC family hydrolase
MLPGPHPRRRHRRGTSRPGLQHRTARYRAAALVTLLALATLALATLITPTHSDATPHTTRPATAPQTPATTAPVQAVPDSITSTTPAARPTSVTLDAGDTLWALARTHHTTVHTLQHLNHLRHSTLIYAGHQLLIPAPTTTPHTAPAPTPTVPSHKTPVHTRQTSTAPRHTTDGDGAATAIGFARRQLGTPYRWGGTGNSGYDCSGLIQAAWAAAGIHLPRTTYAQATTGTAITRSQLHPGDLVFTDRFGHVQLYIGDGRVIEAPHTGATVRYAPLPPASMVNAYRRVTPAPAPVGSE